MPSSSVATPDDTCPPGFEDSQKDEVRRRLHKDDIARIEQRFGDQVEQLLRPLGHHGASIAPETSGGHPLVPLQMFDQHRRSPGSPLCRAVL